MREGKTSQNFPWVLPLMLRAMCAGGGVAVSRTPGQVQRKKQATILIRINFLEEVARVHTSSLFQTAARQCKQPCHGTFMFVHTCTQVTQPSTHNDKMFLLGCECGGFFLVFFHVCSPSEAAPPADSLSTRFATRFPPDPRPTPSSSIAGARFVNRKRDGIGAPCHEP